MSYLRQINYCELFIRLVLACAIVTTCLVLVISTSQAKEGFSETRNSLPASVKVAWDASYLVVYNGEKEDFTGTAFLVNVTKEKNGLRWSFLTARHVLNGLCIVGKPCKQALLIQNARFKITKAGIQNFQVRTPGLNFRDIEIVKADAVHDLALIEAFSAAGAALAGTPLQLAPSCDLTPREPVFTVGYPATSDRTVRNAKPIAHQDTVEKRWNRGLLAAKLERRAGRLFYPTDMPVTEASYIGTTNDALEGSSGSAMVDKNGNVIGLFTDSTGNAQDGFEFLGDESLKNLTYNAMGVSCARLKKFLAE